jgi:hypothetical protein
MRGLWAGLVMRRASSFFEYDLLPEGEVLDDVLAALQLWHVGHALSMTAPPAAQNASP